jgi:hypothetical protein
MKYYWDESVGRFRDDLGRFVARNTIDQFVTQSIMTSTNVTDSLAQMVSNGLINVNDWKDTMRQEIKDEYIRQYLSSMGGREFMTQKDWGSIGGMLTEQYKYLDNFANDIATGELSEAQIMARSSMYVNSASEARERARERVATDLDYDMVEWVVDASLENCDDCLAFAAMGVVSIDEDPYNGAYPGSGDTVCLTNCGCHEEYSKSENGEVYAY